MLRRLRGIVITAILWSLVFTLVQLPIDIALYFGVPATQRAEVWPLLTGMTALWAVTGFLTGAVFAGIIARFGRKRTVAQLSPTRFAWWGIAAGGLTPALAFPMLVAIGLARPSLVVVLAQGVVGVTVGVVTASMTLWTARRAKSHAELSPGEQARAISWRA